MKYYNRATFISSTTTAPPVIAVSFLDFSSCNAFGSFTDWDVFFSKTRLVLRIFKISFKFEMSVKIYQLLFKRDFVEICLSCNKFKFFFNSLKVSLVNRFLINLITFPAGWDLSPVVFLIILNSWKKFSLFFLWSWWRWLVRHFLVGSRETQKPCSRFLILILCCFYPFLF